MGIGFQMGQILWDFISRCEICMYDIDIHKMNIYDRKIRARGQFYLSYALYIFIHGILVFL